MKWPTREGVARKRLAAVLAGLLLGGVGLLVVTPGGLLCVDTRGLLGVHDDRPARQSGSSSSMKAIPELRCPECPEL